jgi:hypothetical protein
MKRKIEAYAEVLESGQLWALWARPPKAKAGTPKLRVVRLVPANPAADAVVRAAIRAVASKARVSWGVRELDALGKAVSRLESQKAKR